MSATVIDFPVAAENRGNGAREALIALAESFDNTSTDDAVRWTDFVLAELWARGFKVVPVE